MNDLPGLLRRMGTYAGLLGASLLFVGDLIGKGTLASSATSASSSE